MGLVQFEHAGVENYDSAFLSVPFTFWSNLG